MNSLNVCSLRNVSYTIVISLSLDTEQVGKDEGENQGTEIDAHPTGSVCVSKYGVGWRD